MSTQSHPLQPMLRKLRGWHPLDDEDAEAVLALPFQARELKPGQHIVWEGDRPRQSCLTISLRRSPPA